MTSLTERLREQADALHEDGEYADAALMREAAQAIEEAEAAMRAQMGWDDTPEFCEWLTKYGETDA